MEKIIQAGEIVIEECMILKPGEDGIDVTSQLSAVTLYEDIYCSYITGNITLLDNQDIPNMIGRGGRDILRLKMYTPSINEDNYIWSYFLIYKIGDRFSRAARTQEYTIFFASEEYFFDISKKISRTYSDHADKIVDNILKNTLASTKKFNTLGNCSQLKYTSNFWSPSTNFRYITDHATDKTGVPSLLFFENRYGFNLFSIDEIIKPEGNPPIQVFSNSNFSIDVESNSENQLSYGQATRDPIRDYQVIQDIRVDSIYNFFDDYAAGMIKTKMYSHDLVTKKLNIKNYEMIQDTGPLLNNYRPYREDMLKSIDPVVMLMTQHYGSNDMGDMSDYKYKQQRIVRIRQLYSQVIEIDVHGRTDYTVGKKVTVSVTRLKMILPSDQPEDYVDNIYSGDYIITAITHKITRSKHFCVLELSKNSTNLK